MIQLTDLPKTSVPATSALLEIGITKLKQLTKYSEKEILALHGVGPKAIRIWKEAMKEKGLSFNSSNG